MSQLKGTQTEKNLLTAFAGESQARNRYTYFASKAKKEGYVQIQSIFEETANHEKEHAKRLFKYLHSGEELEITAAFPAGTIGETIDNLKASAAGENFENTTMYPEYAAKAREEGFEDIAKTFESIAVAELYHEQRFLAFIENIDKDNVFKKEKKVKWRCRNCGYTHEGNEALEVCPACAHARAHFELVPQNY
ncbi:MAG: rubrerythrin family protein [Desulfobacteraceae bacterium]|nr:rubrerythrin family protein [Desulfobacteraceae bacterium]